MPRNSPKQAIRNNKCRSRALPETSEQKQAPLSRRQFAHRHAAVLNAELVAQHYAPVGGRSL